MWFDIVQALSCSAFAAVLGWHFVNAYIASARWWWAYGSLVAAVTVAVALGGQSIPTPALVWFTAAALVLAAVDAVLLRLPNALVYPTVVIVGSWLPAAALLAARTDVALRVVLAGLVVGLGYLALHLMSPHGLGMGDVKFAPAIAMVMAWESWGWVLVSNLAAFFLAAIGGVVVKLWRRKTREIPFGPFMVMGAAVAPTVGDPLLRWWL